jgi:hypothetical protein
MNEILPFSYPDAATADYCEAKAAKIWLAIQTVQQGIISIGQELLEVKAALPHGQFGPWLQARIGWSMSSAENYMNAARAVARNPKLWEFEPSVLYLLTSATPTSAVDEIAERGPLSVEEARVIIERHRTAAWEESCRERLSGGDACDVGDVLFELEQAMTGPRRENAVRLWREHADLLARHAGRAPAELLAEAGLLQDERWGKPATGAVNAQLAETCDGRQLIVWIGSEVAQPHVIADFPKLRDPIASAWQAAVVESAVKRTRARTLDDLREEVL